MCEFSEKLIAWLDQELPPEQAVNVAQHLRACAECRSQVGLYRQLSETIEAYCNAALIAKAKRRSSPRVWRPAFAVTAAAAAAVLLFFLTRPDEYLRSRFSPAPDGVPAIAIKAPVLPPPALEKRSTATIARKTSNRVGMNSPRRSAPPPPSPSHDENWLPSEAPVYIAIPADALFPPGTFPEGVGFVADVNLRPDGSAQRLRLQPQLVGFQRRGTRP